MKKGRMDEARRWYLQAMDDAEFVNWVVQEKKYFDKGCFVAQQAAEKALKACLYALGERVVLGHSTFELSNRLVGHDPSFQDLVDLAKLLDRYYIPTCYPNGLPAGSPFQFYTAKDLEEGEEAMKAVLQNAVVFLKKLGAFPPGDPL